MISSPDISTTFCQSSELPTFEVTSKTSATPLRATSQDQPQPAARSSTYLAPASPLLPIAAAWPPALRFTAFFQTPDPRSASGWAGVDWTDPAAPHEPSPPNPRGGGGGGDWERQLLFRMEREHCGGPRAAEPFATRWG